MKAVTEEKRDEVLKTFESLAARLAALDGMYCWLDEINEVKNFIESMKVD